MSETPAGDVVQLVEAIESRIRRVHTSSLDISFNELFDMSQNRELDISPEYQRLFQWSVGSQSRFIESLLLEMPVPPIFVIEEEDGRYLLIDGLQRISTYLHFRGELEASHLDPKIKKGDYLKLSDCDIVRELNGKTFSDLGVALQIRLKRAFVRVEVVRKGSDPRFKYYMFKRLNTGGQELSDQQVRNCTIRLLNPVFNDFIIKLSETPDFVACTAGITDEQRLRGFDQELVLRFFAFKNWRGRFKHDVADFLTDYMEAVSDPAVDENFDYAFEHEIFTKTFRVFNATLQELSFAFVSRRFARIVKGFSVYHFEAFTIGLQVVLDRIDVGAADQMERLKGLFERIKNDAKFQEITTGGGKNSPGPLAQRIGFVETMLRDEL
jgi:hypothetical protein